MRFKKYLKIIFFSLKVMDAKKASGDLPPPATAAPGAGGFQSDHVFEVLSHFFFEKIFLCFFFLVSSLFSQKQKKQIRRSRVVLLPIHPLLERLRVFICLSCLEMVEPRKNGPSISRTEMDLLLKGKAPRLIVLSLSLMRTLLLWLKARPMLNNFSCRFFFFLISERDLLISFFFF